MTLDECKRKTTSTQFVQWMYYFEKLESEPTADQYYLAQIAAEVRRANQKVERPNSVKLKHFVLHREKPKAVSKLSNEERMARSKSAWLSAVGLSNKDKE